MFFSVEGGMWSESRRVRLEGCKAKVKLRVTEVNIQKWALKHAIALTLTLTFMACSINNVVH